MSEFVDSYLVNSLRLPEFFESVADGKSVSSARTYRKALRSLFSFLKSRDLSPLDSGVYGEWVVDLWRSDVALSTASLYLDIVTSLANDASEESLLPESTCSVIRELRNRLRASGKELWTKVISDERLSNFVTVARSSSRLKGEYSIAADLMILEIIASGNDVTTMTVDKARQIADSAPEDVSSEINRIIDRQSSPRRKYLFDLDQSRRTPRQLLQEVNRLITSLSLSRNIPFVVSLKETGEVIRMLLGLKAGVSAADSLSAIGHHLPSLPVFRIIEPSVSGIDKDEFNRLVSSILLTNPLRWFAIRLRPGVTLNSLKERLKELGNDVPQPEEYFYPHEEIAKRIGRKLVFSQRPFINDVVFIKIRRTDLSHLLARIGDLAWGYTMNGRPGSPYAAIPQYEFSRFQRTIGQFTSDMELFPLDSIEPVPGEPIVFLSGPFIGKEGTFDQATTSPTGSVIYKLRILGDNGLEWRVTARPHEIQSKSSTKC